MNRVVQPYMGVYNEKQWDKRGMLGRFISPIEDLYFEFMPSEQTLQSINPNYNRLVT